MRQLALQKFSFFTFLQSHQNVWISGWYLNIHLYKGKDFVACFFYDDSGAKVEHLYGGFLV